MRIAGHPVHVMLVHFPIALWPAHWAFHLARGFLPDAVALSAAFWLLMAGTALGWLAAAAGVPEWIKVVVSASDSRSARRANAHAAINGTVLAGFTLLAARELAHPPPALTFGPGWLGVEAALLVLLFVGNYFGGALVWGNASPGSLPLQRAE